MALLSIAPESGQNHLSVRLLLAALRGVPIDVSAPVTTGKGSFMLLYFLRVKYLEDKLWNVYPVAK